MSRHETVAFGVQAAVVAFLLYSVVSHRELCICKVYFYYYLTAAAAAAYDDDDEKLN